MQFASIKQTNDIGVCLFFHTIMISDLLKQKRIYIYLWLL